MAKPPKRPEAPEGDPKRGDAILKRMLETKPKPHKDMVAERKAKQDKARSKR
jgi:hypothetical protein